MMQFEPSTWVVIFAATLATLGWAYTAVGQSKAAKKQRTADLMLNVVTNSELMEARRQVSNHKGDALPKNGEAVTEAHLKIQKALVIVLNYYELIAMGVRNGLFDEKSVRAVERQSLKKDFSKYTA